MNKFDNIIYIQKAKDQKKNQKKNEIFLLSLPRLNINKVSCRLNNIIPEKLMVYLFYTWS